MDYLLRLQVTTRCLDFWKSFIRLSSIKAEFFALFYLSHPNLQESVGDFYWHYSGKDVIDVHGQHNFSKAIEVSKQVFNTLTEYIQVSRCSPALVFLYHLSSKASTWSAEGT